MFCPFQLTEDRIEMQFATNHLGNDTLVDVIAVVAMSWCLLILTHFSGHFLLTNLLLDKMKQTAKASGIEGRIVNLSSIAHTYTYEEGIRFDKINDQVGYVKCETLVLAFMSCQ